MVTGDGSRDDEGAMAANEPDGPVLVSMERVFRYVRGVESLAYDQVLSDAAFVRNELKLLLKLEDTVAAIAEVDAGMLRALARHGKLPEQLKRNDS